MPCGHTNCATAPTPITITVPAPHRVVAGGVGRLMRAFYYGAAGLAWRYARRRQRFDLSELDDRLLADIGLTRHEALRETRQPFWRPRTRARSYPGLS